MVEVKDVAAEFSNNATKEATKYNDNANTLAQKIELALAGGKSVDQITSAVTKGLEKLQLVNIGEFEGRKTDSINNHVNGDRRANATTIWESAAAAVKANRRETEIQEFKAVSDEKRLPTTDAPADVIINNYIVGLASKRDKTPPFAHTHGNAVEIISAIEYKVLATDLVRNGHKDLNAAEIEAAVKQSAIADNIHKARSDISFNNAINAINPYNIANSIAIQTKFVANEYRKQATGKLKESLEKQLTKYLTGNTAELGIRGESGAIDPSLGTDSYVVEKATIANKTTYTIAKTHKDSAGKNPKVTYSKYEFDDANGSVKFFENERYQATAMKDLELKKPELFKGIPAIFSNGVGQVDPKIISKVDEISENRTDSLSRKSKDVGEAVVRLSNKTLVGVTAIPVAAASLTPLTVPLVKSFGSALVGAGRVIAAGVAGAVHDLPVGAYNSFKKGSISAGFENSWSPKIMEPSVIAFSKRKEEFEEASSSIKGVISKVDEIRQSDEPLAETWKGLKDVGGVVSEATISAWKNLPTVTKSSDESASNSKVISVSQANSNQDKAHELREYLKAKVETASGNKKQYSVMKEDGGKSHLTIERQDDNVKDRVKYLITRFGDKENSLYSALIFNKKTSDFIGGFKDNGDEKAVGDPDIYNKFENMRCEIESFEREAVKSSERSGRFGVESRVEPLINVGYLKMAVSDAVKSGKISIKNEAKAKMAVLMGVVESVDDLREDEKSGELFYGKTLSKREKALLDSAGVVSKKELIPEAARERDNNVSLDVPYLEHLDIKFSKRSNFSKARMNLFASSTFEGCNLSSIGVNDMRFRHCNFEEGCKLPDDLSEIKKNSFVNCKFSEKFLDDLGDRRDEFVERFGLHGGTKNGYFDNSPRSSVKEPEVLNLKHRSTGR